MEIYVHALYAIKWLHIRRKEREREKKKRGNALTAQNKFKSAAGIRRRGGIEKEGEKMATLFWNTLYDRARGQSDDCNRRCVYDQLNFTSSNEIARRGLGGALSIIKLLVAARH